MNDRKRLSIVKNWLRDGPEIEMGPDGTGMLDPVLKVPDEVREALNLREDEL